MPWNQVSSDEQLLDAAKDYFKFVTTFFEPINVSAPHIYHSALELSPLTSIVRKLYYHQRTPFPRVATGIPDSWEPSTAISSPDYSHESSVTWSPCGQFVATQTKVTVEVRDALTFGLSTTLRPTEPTSQLTGTLAYSPDGRSLACASNTTIIIWDIQTGGVVKEVQRDGAVVHSLAWSLDGGLISTMGFDWKGLYTLTVHSYDAVSGTTLPPITLRSYDEPHLWAHNESFRVITTARIDETRAIHIFEVGPALTEVESFFIQLEEGHFRIKSFSPTTCRMFLLFPKIDYFRILDLRTSKSLLDERMGIVEQCFSPDGSLFAGFEGGSLRIWKYDTNHYVPLGTFQSSAGQGSHFLFSPTLQSILGHSQDTLRLWRLNSLSITPAAHSQQLGVFSCSGAYMATARRGGCTVTITNLQSRNPSWFIDTDIRMLELGLTGNVLLVVGSEAVTAWVLTEEGLVNRVFGDRRAGRGDSIWTVSISRFRAWDPIFSVGGGFAAIKSDGDTLHAYNTRSGEVVAPAQVPLYPSGPWHPLVDIKQARHHLYDGSAQHTPLEDDWRPSRSAMKEGWVKDREGKYLLWLPIEWRVAEWHKVVWFSEIATMRY